MSDQIIRRFDDLGRIVIPRNYTKKLFGTSEEVDGKQMEIYLINNEIVLKIHKESEGE